MKYRAAFCFLMLSVIAVQAKPIELHKGIGTDIWVNWPSEVELQADQSLVETFPEWVKTIGPKQIAELRKAGFDFVRLTIDPMAYVWNANSEKTDKLNANVVKATKMFLDQGLKVLVDFHAIPTGGYRQNGSETYVSNIKAFDVFVEQSAALAKALANQDPALVAFEPMNEPVLDCPEDNTNRWPAMAKQLHRATRQAAPQLTLVMQGACWGGADGLAALDPRSFDDDNIIWDFHSYDPFLFTHQGAEWAEGPERYISGLHFPPQQNQSASIEAATLANIEKAELNAKQKAELRDNTKYNLAQYFENNGALSQHVRSFTIIETWAKKYNVKADQILLGEFGANRIDETAKTLLKDRLTFVERSRREAEKRGYSWSFWDWSGSMSPTNNDQDRVILPSYIKALGLTPRD